MNDSEKNYVVLYGHRRYFACKKLGWKTIPSLIFTKENIISETKVIDIPINKIKILENIRTRIDDEDLAELMQSIKQNGLLQPIGVFKENEPINIEDFLTKNAVENIHRLDNSPIEIGKLCSRLKELGLSISEISARLALPKKRIETSLRIITKVPENFKKHVGYIPIGMGQNKHGKIPATVANAISLLRVKQEDINKLFNISKKEELTKSDIRIIGHLLNDGITLERSLKFLEEYEIKTCTLVVKSIKLQEIMKMYNLKNFSEFIKNIIKGKIPPQTELIV